MADILFQGYDGPAPKKVCTRCLGPNDNQLTELCDVCHTGDELATWLLEHYAEDELWKDEQLTKAINQPI